MQAPPTPEQIAHLRRLLLKKGSEINDKLVAILNKKNPSMMDIIAAKPGETPEERLRRFLKLVDDQIQRVRAGTYGTCATCGDGLPYAHLEQVPWIDTCQVCAAKEPQT
jgi:RNA polymerase-binding transcription factor DksA